ncbi:hypothetical protein R1flu_009887 [Riccia fluitans]|uniref:Uncharacterized protein n=1 Tax=Riccia fluitans TaxID=41844 RepID=A0ABD1Z3E9_9MARC
MVATKDADDDDGGQSLRETASLEHPSNIPPRKDDDGTKEGGPSRPTQASKTLPKSTGRRPTSLATKAGGSNKKGTGGEKRNKPKQNDRLEEYTITNLSSKSWPLLRLEMELISSEENILSNKDTPGNESTFGDKIAPRNKTTSGTKTTPEIEIITNIKSLGNEDGTVFGKKKDEPIIIYEVGEVFRHKMVAKKKVGCQS